MSNSFAVFVKMLLPAIIFLIDSARFFMTSNFSHKRLHFRFKPHEMESLVLIDTRTEALKDDFAPDIIGIALTESRGGCSFVARSNTKIRLHDVIIIKVGELHPLFAEVVWLSNVDKELIKIGIKYRE